jgi:hypothetical protein
MRCVDERVEIHLLLQSSMSVGSTRLAIET